MTTPQEGSTTAVSSSNLVWRPSRLALVEGLGSQSPAAADAALLQFEAVRRLQVWFQRRIGRKRPRKRMRHIYQAHDSVEHWIWVCLRSGSQIERSCARRLLENCEPHRLIPPLVQLIESHIIYSCTDLAYDLAQEWMKLLETAMEKHQTNTLLLWKMWPWLTRCVYKMERPHAFTYACASLALFQAPSSGTQVYHTKLLWKDPAVAAGLSPLAHLIAAKYRLLFPFVPSYAPSQAARTAALLSQLTDPAQGIVVVEESNDVPETGGKKETKKPRSFSFVEGFDDSDDEAEMEDQDAEEENEDNDEDVDEEQTEQEAQNSETNNDDGACAEEKESQDDDDVEMEDASNGKRESDDEDEDIESIDADEDSGVEEEDANDNGGRGSDLPSAIERTFGLSVEGAAAVAMDLDELATAVVQEATTAVSSTKPADRLGKRKQEKTNEAESLSPSLKERQKSYVVACTQILESLYPPLVSIQLNRNVRSEYLTLKGESRMLKSMNTIIKPPKKPLETKVILRRAPTQEEFFRGSLTQNPVPFASLRPRSASASDSYDPTVADLRQHIANDLQMSDSAELIEILVANKILDVRLKLRVVHDVLWRKHLMENPGSGLASLLSSSGSLFSRGSGLSMFFEADDGEREPSRNASINEETPVSNLPSLLATYRLAGVDGEATEDTVGVDDLIDPEATSLSLSNAELERRLEMEYGVTSLVTAGRGAIVLLRAVQHAVRDVIWRIKRDDIGSSIQNESRARFQSSAPCQALSLLLLCSKLPSNKKRLVAARAPTILLTLLLEVLGALEGKGSDDGDKSTGNATADALQTLIENLTSEISPTVHDEAIHAELDDTSASMASVIKSIESISLSAPLRAIIAQLLPYMTYGNLEKSRELAWHLTKHIKVDELVDEEDKDVKCSVLMQTCVATAMNLPSSDISSNLRMELIKSGFLDKLLVFTLKMLPKEPPSWSTGLRDLEDSGNANPNLMIEWMSYYARPGVLAALKIITGLCSSHATTQSHVASHDGFLQCCHWLESTSDNQEEGIKTSGIGLLAETLLDELSSGDSMVKDSVKAIRSATKLRKRKIAQMRRNKALLKMQSMSVSSSTQDGQSGSGSKGGNSVRETAASLFAPVLGLFRDSGSMNESSTKTTEGGEKKVASKPAWLIEAESMVEEAGLKCAVCQEGRTLQPTSLLGLYVHTTRVMSMGNKTLTRAAISGVGLLCSLPVELPASLVGDPLSEDWYLQSLEAQSSVSDIARALSKSSRSWWGSTIMATSTCAGNAIHFTCHRKARQADRNHPKAPKQEWEGASLRNNRAKCNAIFPLVSTQASSVPLLSVNTGLNDYKSALSLALGGSPSSMLWTVLQDACLLLFRMSYGESLSAESGGGSMTSNCRLLYHQLHLVEMFEKSAQIDQRAQSNHARRLSAGCLLASQILFTGEDETVCKDLWRGVADATPMACLTSIAFHNTKPCGKAGVSSIGGSDVPHPKREWVVGRELFLRGLLLCAGRRHALNLSTSGCQAKRTSRRKRSTSFADWDDGDETRPESIRRRHRPKGRSEPSIDDYQHSLRPLITMFAIMDQVSSDFRSDMDDAAVEASSTNLVQVAENCQKSRGIHDLLRKAKVPLDHLQMIKLVNKGMGTA